MLIIRLENELLCICSIFLHADQICTCRRDSEVPCTILSLRLHLRVCHKFTTGKTSLEKLCSYRAKKLQRTCAAAEENNLLVLKIRKYFAKTCKYTASL